MTEDMQFIYLHEIWKFFEESYEPCDIGLSKYLQYLIAVKYVHDIYAIMILLELIKKSSLYQVSFISTQFIFDHVFFAYLSHTY